MKGHYTVLRPASAYLRTQGSGRIVTVTSPAALGGSSDHPSYAAAKAGLNAVVKGLAVDLAPRGICCLALHPGWAKTEPGARVEVDASVAGMRGVIHRAGRHHTGSFLTYADQPLPW